MTLSHVSIYCLPNIRAPWVVVYEPHPWGHGALRVKEENALLVYVRPATKYEQDFMADSKTHVCQTFRTLAGLLDYEDGQHEHVAHVREAINAVRGRVDEVLALVEKKRAAKRAELRRRALPTVEALP